jgi:hypothetical protein
MIGQSDASDAPDGDEFTSNLVYRAAYGEAARIAESRDRSFAHSRDRVRDVRLEAEAMARDIGGRLGVEPAAIVGAVEDALAGRRPRW